MAEWLGRALQKLLQRFESARCLFYFSKTFPPKVYLEITCLGFPYTSIFPPAFIFKLASSFTLIEEVPPAIEITCALFDSNFSALINPPALTFKLTSFETPVSLSFAPELTFAFKLLTLILTKILDPSFAFMLI